MKLIVTQNNEDKKGGMIFPLCEKEIGIISVDRIANGTEFNIRVLNVSHLKYFYDPENQRFEVQFISIEKRTSEREG